MKKWLNDEFGLKNEEGEYVLPEGVQLRPRYRLMLYEATIDAVLDGQSRTKTAKAYMIPPTTLDRLVKRQRDDIPIGKWGQRHSGPEFIEEFVAYVEKHPIKAPRHRFMAKLMKQFRKLRGEYYKRKQGDIPPEVPTSTLRDMLTNMYGTGKPQVTRATKIMAKLRKETWDELPHVSMTEMEERWARRDGAVGEECRLCGRLRERMDKRMYWQCSICNRIYCREHIDEKSVEVHRYCCRNTCHCQLPCQKDESCRCKKSRPPPMQDE